MFVTERALFRQSLPCPQVAAAAAASIFDGVVCIFFTSSFHEWLRTCLVMLTAVLFIVFSTRCRRPPVRTSVLMMSITTSWAACSAAAHHDASFSLLHNLVDKRAFSFPCCCGTSLFLNFAAALLASSFSPTVRALQCQQLCFQLQMLLRYHVGCHLCCCGSCFFLQSLVLHLQQECFLLLQLLRYFFHRFLCHVLLFLFWRRLFFIVTIIS